MKVLEIGAGPLPKAEHVPGWEGAEIHTLDADKKYKPTILCDAGDIPGKHWGQYDGVLASHVLEHFGYWESVKILKHWGELLKEGGQLHIIVPSLEWVARATLSENMPLSVFPHLFGGYTNDWQAHKMMFTMRLLRKYMEEAGFGVDRAKTAPYRLVVTDSDGNEHTMEAEEHYVRGIKRAIIIDEDN